MPTLTYFAIFYALGLLVMAVFVRLYYRKKKLKDAEKEFYEKH